MVYDSIPDDLAAHDSLSGTRLPTERVVSHGQSIILDCSYGQFYPAS